MKLLRFTIARAISIIPFLIWITTDLLLPLISVEFSLYTAKTMRDYYR